MGPSETSRPDPGAPGEVEPGRSWKDRFGRWRVRLAPYGHKAKTYGQRYWRVVVGPGVSTKRRLLYVAGGLALFGVVCWILLFLYTLVLIPFTPGISDLRKAKAERPTVVFSSDGEQIAEFKPVNRQWVDLEEIAPEVIDALIATEDHRFYRHHGVDIKRVFGAIFHTLTGDPQGGSTITQQLARNLYPEEIGREVTLTRKLKELITALKIEYAYEKDEILETYLNTVPFLYNAYGIEMAARTYFSKSADELDLLESATLVGMLKGTYYYNPVRNPERALQRRNVVLGQMVKRGYLDEERLEQLKDEPLGVDFERQDEEESRAPHFTEQVRVWLIDWADRNGYNIYRDSLVVHTTLDTRMQRLAQQAVDRWMPSLQAVADVEWSREDPVTLSRSMDSYRNRRSEQSAFDYYWESKPRIVDAFIRSTPQYREGVSEGIPGEQMVDSLRSDDEFMQALRELKTRLEVGFVALDPETGGVRAWIGSRDFDEDQYDHVVQARRQPGSTFKPIVYATALEEGYSPMDTLTDREVEYRLRNGEVWRPVNEGQISGRTMTLADALAYSKNTITAQLIDEVGVNDVVRLARRMGVRRSEMDRVPSIALGTSEVTLLEMVSVYGTIANEGVYQQPILVSRIEDRDGNVLATFEPESDRVMSEETAVALTDMMRGVVDRGTGERVRSTFGIRADVAGKTGTTQDNADGWFILMHPDLVAGAWVGFNDPRVAFRSNYWGSGGNNALFIVGDFFDRALSTESLGLGGAEFAPPPEYEEEEGGGFGPVGRWFDRAFRNIGRWVGLALEAAGNAIFGEEPEQATGIERPSQRVSEEDFDAYDPDAPGEEIQESDSLNRVERDSTQLNRLLERLREREGEQQEGTESEVDAEGEGLLEEQEQELPESVVNEPGEGAGASQVPQI